MRTHKLKVLPLQYEVIAGLLKTHDLRYDDRGFRVGDQVMLQEWLPVEKRYSGRSFQFTITHINRVSQLIKDIDPKWVILSMGRTEERPPSTFGVPESDQEICDELPMILARMVYAFRTQTEPISMNMISGIAKALGVRTLWLTVGEGDPRP